QQKFAPQTKNAAGPDLESARLHGLQFWWCRRQTFALFRLVKLQRAVETSHRDAFAVLQKGESRRHIRLQLEGTAFRYLGCVPKLERAVFTRGQQRSAVGRKSQVQDGAFVRELRQQEGIGGFGGGFGNLPNPNAIIRTGGSKPFPVRTPSEGILFLQRLGESLH